MRERAAVTLIIVFNVLLLLFGVSTLSISYYEADIFYRESGAVHYLVKFSTALFGQNDYALRVPFVILHTLSVILLYQVSKPLLKREFDRIINILIYVLLPGTISAALLVNGAGIVIFMTLLFLFLWQREERRAAAFVLLAALFLDDGFVILYFLLFFYAVFKRDVVFMVVSLTLFTIAAYMYGIEIGGRPKGYFLDSLGVYAAIFSPFLFLYFVYVEYRILIKGKRSLLWWLSFGAFVISLLLSFRQRLPFEEFAPYAVIATPLLVSTFFNSFRVRLPRHRKVHKILAALIVLSLVVLSALVFANQSLYAFYGNPNKHYAYKYHVAKELAEALRKNNIESVSVSDEKMALRLRFYGIEKGGAKLSKQANGQILIVYKGIEIERWALRQ